MASLILGITWSCQTDDELKVSSEKPNDPEVSTDRASMIKLGKKLDNPYSISNMREAFRRLRELDGSRISEEEIGLEPTKLYVKFAPGNTEELEVLKDDTTLVLFEYPLDYEFEALGDYYHDPEVPDSLPTYQYAVVNLDYQFPSVTHEILDSAYIPPLEESDVDPVEDGRRVYNFELMRDLEQKAFEITGNSSEGARNCSDYKPEGYVKVDGIGIRGVEVRVQNFLKINNTYAEADGHYYISTKYSRSSRRSIHYQRYDFAIKDGWLDDAKYVDGEECGDWSVNFVHGSKQAYFADVFRAAFHYYYQDIRGLRRPPQNSITNPRVGIRAHLKNGSPGVCYMFDRFISNEIEIKTLSSSSSYTYGTTIHELAHASHWEMDRNGYNFSDQINGKRIVVESWANGVEWSLTTMIYAPYYGTTTVPGEYTNVVIDMIDGPSATDDNEGFEDLSKDNVTGYTIRQIEDALNGKKSWNGWRDNIKTKYPNNATKNNLDLLFTSWL